MSHLDGALAWQQAGCSVIPVLTDGSKRPLGSWAQWQQSRACTNQIRQWWKIADYGVGIVCGAVSGNLELLEIEACRMGSEYLSQVWVHCDDLGVADIWDELSDKGYMETTPSGGIHFLYRIDGQPVPGNTKIAMSENGKITYAETRGEGGFVVVAPSSGTIHKTGEAWTCIAGEVGVIPTITWEDRNLLHQAIREALDERVLPVYERPAAVAYDRAQGDRPGDAYNDDPSVTVHDILLRNGWKYLGKSRGQDRYVHPHSSDMTTHSAVTGHRGSPNLYAWSGLPAEDYYTKYSLLTHLEFNGDFSAASRYLRGQGYGSQGGVDISDWFEQTPETTGSGMEAVVEATTPGVEGSPTPVTPSVIESDGLPAIMPGLLDSFTWREADLPELFRSAFRDNLRYISTSRMWRVWDGVRWAEDLEGRGERASQKLLAKLAKFAEAVAKKDPERGDILKKAAKGLTTMSKMRALSGLSRSTQDIAAAHNAFDRVENLVTVDNGVLDLNTGKLLPHDASRMLTKKMNVAFDPDADPTVLNRFLEDWLPDPLVRGYVCRLLAVTLTGRADERVIPMLYGGSGSGKTAFLEMIYHVFGDFGAIASEAALKPRADQDGPSEKLHQLKGSRMVKLSELSQGSVLNEALVKSITGSDTQSTRKLYGDIEEWKVQYVVWLATNHLPTISSNDEAIWNRVKPINFPGRFIDDTGRVLNPEHRDLGRKLASGHASAVLNWILAGLRDYEESGLNEPEIIGTWLNKYRDDIDTTRQFMAEAPDAGMIEIQDEATVGARELYKVYVAWSLDNHLRPVSIKSFKQRLESSGWKQVRRASGMMWLGVKQTGFIAEAQRPLWDPGPRR